MQPTPIPSPAKMRRSPCPIAAGLDLFGDRWTLLVVQDLLGGPRRFKDLFGSVEGVPTNVLSARLTRLLRHGVIVRVEAPNGGKHLAYRLTDKGAALRPVVAAFNAWPASEAVADHQP